MTQVPEKSTKHPENTPLATEKARRTSEKPTVHPKKTTSTIGKTTPVPAKPTENPENTAVTKSVRPPVTVAGDKSIASTSPYLHKTEVTHQVPIGSFTLTASRMELSSIMSEASGNKSHQYQNKDGSQGGLHSGQMDENDPFPAWAIVIVILVAVILLLVFLGVVFLVSYVMRTRRGLTQNTQDNDPEDEGGPNSYPVYLMEQQTLGRGQIPSPR
ncbi:mucin-like protein 3 [Eulemur rufifrons]|uniref:mucin-like protein 3 n=1 Tax=Eulemur rufifrons TaxID=859984 RepID=UPI0037446425